MEALYVWEKSSNKITPGKNKDARWQPGSICRNAGYTLVSLEMKQYGTHWHSTLEMLWSVWSESFSGATEKINYCFKSKNYSYQANSGKNSSKFSFLHPSSILQWWHPQEEKMTPPSRHHYNQYYAYDGPKIRYQEGKNPKKTVG